MLLGDSIDVTTPTSIRHFDERRKRGGIQVEALLALPL
jgi:hypothetical protein